MPLPSYYPSASEIASVTTYEYDDAHNRVERVRDGVAAAYSYNQLNQMTGYVEAGASVSYTYDANGNRKTRTVGTATDSYDYDAENRLVGTSKGGVSHSYTYDYRTRRVERVEGGVATKIVFSGGTSVQEYTGASVQAEYVRGSDYGGGIGGLLYSLRAGVPSYTHYNTRGDVAAKTDPSGGVTWQAAYEAFGKRPAEVGATPDRQKASTKEEDPTGLLNEGFRYRDLETGEFITRDPAGFLDGPNLYAYVRQNPWSKFDAYGLAEGTLNRVKEVIGGGVTVGPIDAYDAAKGKTAKDARKFAKEMARKYGTTPQERADIENAVRHATWQARLTQKHGEEDAKAVGDLHELGESRVRPGDSARDLHNNQKGRDIGKNTSNFSEAAKKVEDLLKGGELMLEDPQLEPKRIDDPSSSADSSNREGSNTKEYDQSSDVKENSASGAGSQGRSEKSAEDSSEKLEKKSKSES